MILVVEDEVEVRTMIAEYLRRSGYDVTVAADPNEAIALSRHGEGCPELIVTDVKMPHMTGTEMIMQLRHEWPDLRVVFMSGYTEDPLLESEFFTAPILYKPFDLSELTETLHAIHSVSGHAN